MIFNRPDEQVFASTAKSGEVEDFPDILRGWGLTFDQTGGIPPMEWFNALGLRTDQAIQYFLQHGIPEWGENTDYIEGAYAKHNNKVWRSKKRNSGNEPTALNDNWEQAALTLEEVKAIIPQLMTKEELEAGVSETPRTINAQLLKVIKSKNNFVFYNVNNHVTLTEEQAGVILIDASAGDITVTLPNTENNIGFILRRVDNTVYKVKIQVSGTDKIKYNASINANGYSFFHLFGAGDYWRVVSDGLGNWFDIERKDTSPIGVTEFITSTLVPVGGYVVANGVLLSRADYPYLWDYAQKSGLLVDETNKTGYEGCFTKGDGATTFRVPDLRGNFLRALDTGRDAGSYQEDAIRNITGNFITSSEKTPDVNASGVFKYEILSAIETVTSKFVIRPGLQYFFDTSLTVPTAEENRPVNIAYPVYIKII